MQSYLVLSKQSNRKKLANTPKMKVTEFVTGVYLPIILLFIGAVIMKLLLTYKTKIFDCHHEDNNKNIRKTNMSNIYV